MIGQFGYKKWFPYESVANYLILLYEMELGTDYTIKKNEKIQIENFRKNMEKLTNSAMSGANEN